MRAVLYVRVSTEEQVENYSLGSQQQACEAYCKTKGIEVDRVFREEGESAKTEARTQLQLLLSYCSKNARRIDLVVVDRTDRFSRAAEVHHAVKAKLRASGIRLASVKEDYDDSPVGKFAENMFVAAAQFDNDMRAQRTTDGMRAGVREGRWMWGAPIGYVRPQGRTTPSLVPDPDTAHLVRLAFELYAQGDKTKREIWDYLTDLGLLRGGKALSLQSFGAMFKNPIYRGRIVSPKLGEDVPGDFQPLVSDELFERVQKAHSGARAGRVERTRDHPDFPLRRLTKCGQCGTSLTASWSRGRSKRYAYYFCPRKGCTGTSIPRESFESLFVDFLASLSMRSEGMLLMAAVVEDLWSDRVQVVTAERSLLQKRISECESRLERLLSAYLYEDKLDKDTYDAEKKRLEVEINSFETRLRDTELPDVDVIQAVERAQGLLRDLPGAWNRIEPAGRSAFVRAMFPAGLWYNEGIIGTAEIPWLLDGFQTSEGDDAGLVPPTGFEPVLPP